VIPWRFDPFSAELREDPGAAFRRATAHGGVRWGKPSNYGLRGAWYVFGYADVRATLRDDRFGREVHQTRRRDAAPELAPPPELAPLIELLDRWVMFRDPPYHTRLRRAMLPLVQRETAPAAARALEELRARCAAIGAREHGELVAELADPTALGFVCELLGIPPAPRAAIERDLRPLAALLDMKRDPAVLGGALHGAARLRELLARLLAGDAPPAPIAALIETGALDEGEAIASAILLLATGRETLRNQLANLARLLLAHPAAAAWAGGDPKRLAAVVAEALRVESPVQVAGRVALEDVELGGQRVLRGEPVLCMLGAANRDPTVWGDPDAFVPGRIGPPPLSFGGGIHACVGAAASRLIAAGAAVLLGELARTHAPATARARWAPTVLFRSQLDLHVTRRARAEVA
jgi:cytochrome P450